MNTETVSLDASAVLVTGPAASGKTESIVRRVVALLESGVDAREILVFTCSPSCESQMKERLCQASPKTEDVTVTTPFEQAIALLSSENARSATGRTPRILNRFEMTLLLEDLTMLGGDQKRNKEIVKFLLREWTELGEDKERFIINSEENNLNEGLKDRLRLRGGMLAHELANIAVHYLRSDPTALEAAQHSYVLVDDAQNMCLASQVLAEMLAAEQIVMVGDPAASCEVLDPYPYPKGLEEFASRHEESDLVQVNLEGTWLSPAVCDAVNTFCEGSSTLKEACAESNGECARGHVSVRDFEMPLDEQEALLDAICRLPEEERVRSIVMTPRIVDAIRLKLLLEQRGVTSTICSCDRSFAPVKGISSEASQQAYSLISLAANVLDGVAWRSWFSQDETVHGSGLWHELEERAQESDREVAEMLLDLDFDYEVQVGWEQPHLERIVALRESALAARERIGTLAGMDLIEAVADEMNVNAAGLAFAFEIPVLGQTCSELSAALYDFLTFGERSQEPGLRIGVPSGVAGLRASNAYILTTLQSCYPSKRAIDPTETVDHRRYYLARDEKEFYVALTRSLDALCISWPQEEELERATRAGMGVSRIYGTEAGRRARLAPSSFIARLH